MSNSSQGVAVDAVAVPDGTEYETALDVVLGLAHPLPENPTPQELALHRGLAVARHIWAASTWRSSAYLWRRYQQHAAEMARGPRTYSKEDVAISFCETQAVCPASRHTYATALLSVFKRLGEPVNKFRTYATALTAEGATAPHRQAPPASRAALTTLLMRATDLETKATLFLLWKASARMSDVRSLVKESFVVEREGRRIIISWGPTKTTRLRFNSPHAVTVVDGERPMTILTDRIAQLAPRQRFTTVTVAQMNRFLREMMPQAGLTSHSFKHGSVRHLMQQVELGALTMGQVQQAARHQRLESTLTYEADPTIRGPALGTQTATRLL